MSNPCAGPSAIALSPRALSVGSTLTSYTSDVRGHVNTGEAVEHALQVDTDGASLFYLSWVTGTLGLALTDPVGTVIDPAYAATHTDVVTYVTSSGSEMTPPFASYAFTTTVPGLYVARVTAGGDVGTTGTDYLLFAAMETPRTLSVALDKDHYQIGDTATVTATLEESHGALATTAQHEIARGIPGATVQAAFSRSDGITDTLVLADQGDGTYWGTYVIPDAPGYLHLRVTAEGSDGGTPFNRQVDRLLTVASQAVQLTGTYGDRAQDADGDGRYEALIVDVEVLASAGDFSFSANLVDGVGEFIAHTISQITLIESTQSVPLRFNGDLIHDRGRDGPFTVTDLLIGDLQNVGIPSVIADDVWTTAAYDHTEFGRITGDMDGNCVVDVVDIMLVADRWRATIGDGNYNQLYDQDRDGDIDIVDIMLVASRWGCRCGDECYGTAVSAISQVEPRPLMGPAAVRVAPGSSMVAWGETFTVAVEIEGAVDLGGFQMAMNFAPAVVRVDSVTLGHFLGSTGRSTVPLGPEIGDDAGTITFGGFSFGDQPGPDGDGVLAILTLTAQGTGSSLLGLESVQVVETGGQTQTVTVEDGAVVVGVPQRIYLPLIGEQ